MHIKDLQKTCGKLNIDAPNADTLLEISDIQKIKKYIQAHANNQIERCEAKSVIIIRRGTQI